MSHARSNCTRVLGKQRTRHARRRSARPPARKTWPGGAAARFLAWRPGVRGVNARTSIKKMHAYNAYIKIARKCRCNYWPGAPSKLQARPPRPARPMQRARTGRRVGLRKMLQRTCVHTCKSNMTRRMHAYYIKHACPQHMCIYTVRHAKSGRRVAHFIRPAHVKAPRQGDLWGGRP